MTRNNIYVLQLQTTEENQNLVHGDQGVISCEDPFWVEIQQEKYINQLKDCIMVKEKCIANQTLWS